MGRKKRERALARSLRKLEPPRIGSNGDVMGLAFIVLMEAAKSAREDLKAIMDAVKAINRGKTDWRHVAPCRSQLVAAVLADTHRVERRSLKLIDSLEVLALDDLKDKLDSLDEMGEMESLRLQMSMDRLAKMMASLSNVMKKMSETSSQIAQNLK